ncbi:Glycosyl hydrolase, BNR repeat precursor [Fimbriiglobus ruber]|uniref:Glycosyl hydrolase, BNR repeat n=2 Tax=Fimbriiglobus ruber TaxID=1908690 RepID=A0A225DZN1_9BACT|nr:Glycosyl hydrolase, BNR repeat precursor [Fimbriiglobus ruber]
MEQLEARWVPTTFTWTGGGGNPDWGNPGNWSGNVAPSGNPTLATLDDLVFPASATQRTTNDNLTIPGGFPSFKSITIASGGYIINGNEFSLVKTTDSGSGTLTLNNGVNAAITGTINAPINLSVQTGVSDPTLSFNISVGSTLVVNGQITDVSAAVPSLATNDFGTLELTADNSPFTGTIKVNTGILEITNANALGSSTGGNQTTVSQNAQLQLNNVAGTINEPLIVNGPGPIANGALLSIAGTNVWNGPIQMDSNTTIGAAGGTVLNISGQISDLTQQTVTKEGSGEVVFSHVGGNTYHGQTVINDGVLQIQDPLSLGAALVAPPPVLPPTGTAPAEDYAKGTIVNTSPTESGQLQLFDPTDVGFTVLNEALTLNGNGPGLTGVGSGALSNISGNNVWAGNVFLGSAPPNGAATSIGAEQGTVLVIEGVIGTGVDSSNNAIGNQNWSKVDTGEVVLTNHNTYTGTTTVMTGALNIRDSQALGTNSVFVNDTPSGAALELEAEAGNPTPLSLLPPPPPGFSHSDAHGRNLFADSVTGVATALTVSNQLFISGRGINGTGALLSIAGINTWAGPIDLNTDGNGDGIGVDADVRGGHETADSGYFADDYKLTVTGVIDETDQWYDILDTVPPPFGAPTDVSPTLYKDGTGQLVLAQHNLYEGATTIDAGWITAENDFALGEKNQGERLSILTPFNYDPNLGNDHNQAIPDALQPAVTVMNGAALHIKAPDANPADALTIDNNLVLNGFGITHPFGLISNKGALMNIGGINTLTGQITLGSQAGIGGQVGIGVEQVDADLPSELTTTGKIIDGTVGPGGITKLGSRQLNVQGPGTYTGPVDIQQGILQAQSDTALGTQSTGTTNQSEVLTQTTTTVEAGATLALGATLPTDNGGLTSGIQVWDEQLILNGQGSTAIQNVVVGGSTGTFTLTYNGVTTGPLSVTSPTLASDIQTALNGLSTINGIGGSVSVASASATAFVVTFAGNTLIQNPYQLVVTGAGGATGNAGPANLTVENASADNMWRGPVTLNTSVSIDTAANTRLSLFGTIDDASNADPNGSGFAKLGTGDLALGGAGNSYRGQTVVGAGVLTVENSQALGATSNPAGTAGTTVASGAQIQLEGNVTIAGEPLSLAGSGPDAASTPSEIPVSWFSTGPSPENDGEAPGSLPVSGRVTGTAVDPTNPNIIYISTAGGGAWKTLDGGVTWVQLTDAIPGQNTTQNPFAMFSGAIAVAPNDPNVVYLGTGEADQLDTPDALANGSNTPTNAITAPGQIADSYYGTGVYKSTDGGQTWTLLTDPAQPHDNPLYGQAVEQIVVDPSQSDLIYVATSNQITNAPTEVAPAGVWRYYGGDSTWYDLTGSPSNNRQASNKGPGSPGPDDDFRLDFPALVTGDATPASFTSISLAPSGVLYAALGTKYINGTFAASSSYNNGVYRVEDPAPPSASNPNGPSLTNIAATWYAGPGNGAVGGASSSFPVGDFSGTTPVWNFPTQQFEQLGDIKIVAVATNPDLSPDFPGPGSSYVPLENTTLYATVSYPTDVPAYGALAGTLRYVEVSTNGGVTWSAVKTLPANFLGNQGYYDSVLLATNASTVYLGGQSNASGADQFLLTTDGGNTWTDLTTDTSGHGPVTGDHAIAIVDPTNPNSNIVLGTDGGIWEFNPGTNPATTGAWSDLNGDLTDLQVTGVAAYPTDSTQAVYGTRTNGTVTFTNSPTGTGIPTGGGDILSVQQNQQTPSILYESVATNGGEILKSTDGGQTWAPLSTLPILHTGFYPNHTVFPFAVDTQNGNRLVVGGDNPNASTGIDANFTPPVAPISPSPSNLLQESFDGGVTWANINLPLSSGTVTAIGLATNQGSFVADPGFPLVTDIGANSYDKNTIYVTDGTHVYLTKNGGTSWVDRSPVLNAFSITDISSIAVDPSDRDVVYITSSASVNQGERILKSTDAGQTWTDISGNLPQIPTWSVAVDPRDGSVYVGNDNGVYQLAAGAVTWTQFGSGMPTVQVRDLTLNLSLNTLTAATYGRGAFQLFLNDAQPATGALRASTGSSVWTGPIALAADTTISANGTQTIQDGITTAQLNIIGSISDANPGTTTPARLTKVGQGNVTLSGTNSYAGITEVGEGVLITNNPDALGASASTVSTPGNQFVFVKTASGFFTLTFEQQTTPLIDATLSPTLLAQAIQTALDNLSTIGGAAASSVLVTPPLTGPNNATGTGYLVTFQGALAAQAVPTIVTNTYGVVTATNVSSIQQLTVTGVQGSFVLTFNGATTGSLDASSPTLRGDIANALDALTTIGGVGGAVNVTGGGGIFTVTFTSGLADTNVPLIVASPYVAPPTGQLPLDLTGVTTPFVLTFNGQTTAPITTDTAGAIQAALNNLSNVGAAGATVAVAGTAPVYTVTFGGTLQNATNLNPFVVAEAATPTVPVVVPFTGVTSVTPSIQQAAVQYLDITLTGAGTGQLTLSYGGVQTANPITVDPTKNPATLGSDIQAALNGLSTLAGANIVVSPSGGPTNQLGVGGTTRYTITFTGPAFSQSNNLLIGAPLTGPMTDHVDYEHPPIDQININGTGPLTGWFTLTFGNVTTTDLNAASPTLASDIQAALNNLTSVYQVRTIPPTTPPGFPQLSGSVTVTQQANKNNFTITFGGAFDPGVAGGLPYLTPGFANQHASDFGLVTGGPIGATVVQENSSKQSVNVLLPQTGTPQTFTLSFNGQTTAPIDPTSSANLAAIIQTDLNSLSTIGGIGGSVVVQQDATVQTLYYIQFGGALTKKYVPQITANDTGAAVPTSTTPPNVVVTMINPGGTFAGTIVDAGSALELSADLESEPILLNGDGILFNNHYTGALRNISGNNTYTGAITLETNTTVTDVTTNATEQIGVTVGVDPGTTLTIGTKLGVLKGAGTISDLSQNVQLTKELTGTLILADADSYGGSTVINQGAIDVENATALGTPAGPTDVVRVLDGGQLQIQSPAGSPNVIVAGRTLYLSGQGIIGAADTSNNVDSGALLAAGGATAWVGPIILNSAPVQLILPLPPPTGGFTLVPATTPSSTINVGAVAGASVNLSGSVTEAGGSFGLDKVGTGTVALVEADSYTGQTTVDNGVLLIYNPASLGTPPNGGTVVNAGGTLEIDGDPTNVGASITVLPISLTLNGAGFNGAGALLNDGGNNTLSGPVTLATDSSVAANAGTVLTLAGTVQDPSPAPVPAAALTKIGAGVVVLPVANTYTGETFVDAGYLAIENPSALGQIVSEQQTILAFGTAGSFDLTFEGATSTPITVANAEPPATLAAAIQAALNSLPSITSQGGTVTVAPSASVANLYVVTFGGGLANANLPLMTSAIVAPGPTAVVAPLVDGSEGTVVNAGGTLALLGGITVSSEALTLNGAGANGDGALQSGGPPPTSGTT